MDNTIDRKRPRRTKIVATLGPSTDSPKVIRDMLAAGVNVVRCNLSHGSHAEHKARIAAVRAACQETETVVAVMCDLQGPKIRIGDFVQGSVRLASGDMCTIDATMPLDAGSKSRFGLTYPQLIDDVSVGDVLLIDDGRLRLSITAKEQSALRCTVIEGGILSNRKGINRLGGGLSADALTEKDKADIRFAADMDADYLAVSFVRHAEDIVTARQLAHAAGASAIGIIAKIERSEALIDIDAILDASDAVMVARGDLGVEIGDPNLPAWQKDIIHRARCCNRIVITATQMMDSMTHHSVPTRAEVFDVANAVIDGTDAVMLSGETSVGDYPVAVVRKVHDICVQSEKHRRVRLSQHRLSENFSGIEETIAMSSMYAANHFDIAAIAAFTESGTTTRLMSRISSGVPIYALSINEQTLRRVALYRGVTPIPFSLDANQNEDTVLDAIIDTLQKCAVIRSGDMILLSKGDTRLLGGTNTIKILCVPDKAAHRTTQTTE